MWLELILLVILIAVSGLFSGSEIALFSLSDIKVRKLVKQRRRGARTLKKLKDDPHRLLITILIGNNLVNITAAGVAAIMAVKSFGSTGLGIATGVMTFLILVFGEITPKSYFHQNAEKTSLLVSRPVYVLSKILYPVIVFIEAISNGILRIFGSGKESKTITEEELKTALQMGAEVGVIERDEEEMIHNIFEFGDTDVDEVMVRRKSVVAIRSDLRLIDVLTKMLETRYSRIPVYKNDLDNIIGIVNIRSILPYIRRKEFDIEIEKIVTPVLFVREDKNLDLLLDEFRESGNHMAIVLGKDKRVKGLVTLEDLLEEIVGEIYDESDIRKTKMRFMDRKTAIVDGELLVDDIEKKIGFVFRDKKERTISGLVLKMLGRRPRKGDKIKLKNFYLIVNEVDKADKKRIKRIKIVKRRGKIKR